MVSTMTSAEQVKIPEGYKQTEVGVKNSSGMNFNDACGGPKGGGMDSRRIPEDWVLKTIEEITSIVGDGIHATPAYSATGGYFFVNGNNIDQGKRLTGNEVTVGYFQIVTKHIEAGEFVG